LPESKLFAPVGTLVDVTVCAAESLFVQTTVLFTPIFSVIFAGEKLTDWLVPAPLGMETEIVLGVLETVLLELVELLDPP
jgi:hypothetical protein